jgi:hypothetical protein
VRFTLRDGELLLIDPHLLARQVGSRDPVSCELRYPKDEDKVKQLQRRHLSLERIARDPGPPLLSVTSDDSG